MKTLISLLLFAALTANAATIYVSKSGSDSNAGTQVSPFLTVQRAITNAVAGDTISIGAGNYAEAVSSIRGGTAGSYITLDGNGVATLRQVTFKHPYLRLINTTVSGNTTKYAQLVLLSRGAHYCIVSNNVVNAANAIDVAGISWTTPATKPFGSDAASNCLIVSNRITGILADMALNIFGDNNLILGNYIHDIGQSDFIRLWGRTNIIRGNTFTNNFYVAGTGNHMDFIQTFGNLGFGSRGHILEQNLISLVEYGQISQLEGNLIPDVCDWTFRNNIFHRVNLQGSGTIPDLKIYNNLFYQCNWTNKGHVLSYGTRWYNRNSVSPTSPYWDYVKDDVPTNGILNHAEQDRSLGGRYYVLSGLVDYMGKQYKKDAAFYGSTDTNYTVLTNGTVVVRTLPNFADGAKIFNNVFLDSGDPTKITLGWYSLGTELQNVEADYNYVAKAGFVPVKQDTQQRIVGDTNGWSSSDWYEPNGINGGDPKFSDIDAYNVRLLDGSPLVLAGTEFLEFDDDYYGNERIGLWSIGPSQTGDYATDPEPPVVSDNDLVLWLNFDRGFATNGYVEDLSGGNRHAYHGITTNIITATNGAWASTGGWWQTNRTMSGGSVNYYASQYLYITNLTGLQDLTNATIMFWAQLKEKAEYPNALVIGSGYNPALVPAASNSWRIGTEATGTKMQMTVYNDPAGTPSRGNTQLEFPAMSANMPAPVHFTVVFDRDAGQVYGYQDGALVTNAAILSYMDKLRIHNNTANNWLGIGAWGRNYSYVWDGVSVNDNYVFGMLDDIRIYSRALSDAEVLSVYSTGELPPADDVPPPVIVSVSDSLTVLQGSAVRLEVVASGDNLSYQWRKNGVNLEGQTSGAFSLTAAALSDAGDYECVVSNLDGEASIAAISLNVLRIKRTIIKGVFRGRVN